MDEPWPRLFVGNWNLSNFRRTSSGGDVLEFSHRCQSFNTQWHVKHRVIVLNLLISRVRSSGARVSFDASNVFRREKYSEGFFNVITWRSREKHLIMLIFSFFFILTHFCVKSHLNVLIVLSHLTSALSLLGTSYPTFFHFLRYIQIFEVPWVSSFHVKWYYIKVIK